MKRGRNIVCAVVCVAVFAAAVLLLFKAVYNSLLTAEKIAAITTPTFITE